MFSGFFTTSKSDSSERYEMLSLGIIKTHILQPIFTCRSIQMIDLGQNLKTSIYILSIQNQEMEVHPYKTRKWKFIFRYVRSCRNAYHHTMQEHQTIPTNETVSKDSDKISISVIAMAVYEIFFSFFK